METARSIVERFADGFSHIGRREKTDTDLVEFDYELGFDFRTIVEKELVKSHPKETDIFVKERYLDCLEETLFGKCDQEYVVIPYNDLVNLYWMCKEAADSGKARNVFDLVKRFTDEASDAVYNQRMRDRK